MRVDWPVEIAGTGASLPTTVVPNQHFIERLETSDDWIVQRTGIRERRIAQPGESTLKFSTEAAKLALTDAAMPATDIDLILTATITPEHPLPSTACELQAELGCRTVPAFDLAAACSGFVYGLATAAQFVTQGMARNALVVGAESLTRITDMQDRSTAVIFGDGAGAAILRKSTLPERRILAVNLGADGTGAKAIWVPAGGASEPASSKTVNERLHYMRMKGREVYKFAVSKMCEIIETTLADAGESLDRLSMVIPHQSNMRIIESACEKLKLPLDRVLINIDRYGNTSAASIPIAFQEARDTGRLKRGDMVMLVAFGAGLTWGSVLLRF
ncbi:MAG: beta-ketoacyl-ACP synthase III [Phycisphaerae bacterium]